MGLEQRPWRWLPWQVCQKHWLPRTNFLRRVEYFSWAITAYSYSVPAIFSEPSQCAGGPDKRGTWGDPRPVEADRGRAGVDETFYILVATWWELLGIFLANETIRLQCSLTQGYLHLFLTVTATRSASCAETKEEIVSKYVIALNEVKWDTHKSDLWPAGCWPGQRRGLARGEMILLKVNSWNNSGASPQGRRPPICRLLRCKKEKGLQEVDTWITVSHNVQWIKLPGKSDPFTVLEQGNQWLRF